MRPGRYAPADFDDDYPIAQLEELLRRRREQVPGFEVHTPGEGEPSLRVGL